MASANPSLSARQFRTNTTVQRSVTIYSFSVSADQLLEIARVDRFGESSDGVNRKLNERHAMNIAEAMLKPDTVMLDAICGDLRGSWEFDASTGIITMGDDAYISIDDGQHRWHACMLLNLEERARWQFTIQATQGIDYETRLKIFRQQTKRKPIDSRLDLAQRNRLDDWSSEAEREAYRLVLQLNSDTTSPLKGMIVLEETTKRSYEHKHREAGINAAGLWRSLKSAMSKGSPLYQVSMEKRIEVVVNMIKVASETWPKAWKSNNHILTTARGINAVVKLIVSGPNFRMVVGDDFRIESLRNALGMASSFNWTTKRHKGSSTDEITAALDHAIARAKQRSIEVGDSEVIV